MRLLMSDGNNGKGKEQKKREAEERAMVQEAKRANKFKEAVQCCVQEWQKGRGSGVQTCA